MIGAKRITEEDVKEINSLTMDNLVRRLIALGIKPVELHNMFGYIQSLDLGSPLQINLSIAGSVSVKTREGISPFKRGWYEYTGDSIWEVMSKVVVHYNKSAWLNRHSEN